MPSPDVLGLVPGSARSRRAAQGLLAGIALIGGLGLAALIDYRLARPIAEMADLQARIDQYRSIQARRPTLAAEQAVLEARWRDSPDFLRKSSPAQAGADLQNRLGTLIRDLGGRVRSTQFLEPRPEPDLVRIGLQVEMTGTIEVLRAVFYQIEADLPRLIIDAVSIGPAGSARQEPGGGALDAAFAVFGLMPTASR